MPDCRWQQMLQTHTSGGYCNSTWRKDASLWPSFRRNCRRRRRNTPLLIGSCWRPTLPSDISGFCWRGDSSGFSRITSRCYRRCRELRRRGRPDSSGIWPTSLNLLLICFTPQGRRMWWLMPFPGCHKRRWRARPPPPLR